MTKYLFICNSGEALPIALRLSIEGHEVSVYIHNPKYKKNYDGMVEKLSMRGLPGAAKTADLIIFDMNKPVEGKEDRALQKIFGVTGGNCYGPIADKLQRQGKSVLGSSVWTEEIELHRLKGQKLSGRVGLQSPVAHYFGSLSKGADFLESDEGKKTLWVFKPFENQDLDLTYVERNPGELKEKFEGEYKKRLPDHAGFILQEVIDGVEISTEAWWTGKKWVLFNHTIEDKCLMNDDLGPRIGSANNTVWLKSKKGLNVKVFEKLSPYVKRAGYVGPVDVNCIVSKKDHKPYFLEWTPRMGYDAVYCLLSFFPSVGSFFEYVTGRKRPKLKPGFSSSVRVSVPPYPYETPDLLERAKGVAIEGDLEDVWLEDVQREDGRFVCSGADGILGVIAKHGTTLGGSAANVYAQAKKIKVEGYPQYRTDAGKRAGSARRTLEEWGIEVD